MDRKAKLEVPTKKEEFNPQGLRLLSPSIKFRVLTFDTWIASYGCPSSKYYQVDVNLLGL